MDVHDGHELALELAQQREWLRKLARAHVGANDADDLAQATYVIALERPPREAGHVRAWLRGIARNLARERWRANARRARNERAAAREEAEAGSAEIVERVDSEHRITREVLALGEPTRTTLLMRYHEGLTTVEIARRLGQPESTVRARIHRGLADLRGRLDKEFGGERALAVVLMELAQRPALPAGLAVGGGLMLGWKWMLGSAALALGIALAVPDAWNTERGALDLACADGPITMLEAVNEAGAHAESGGEFADSARSAAATAATRPAPAIAAELDAAGQTARVLRLAP